MSAIKELHRLYLEDQKNKYPNNPYSLVYSRKPNSANGLTRCIIDFAKYTGGHLRNIKVTGRPIDDTKMVIDVIGITRRIGSITWVKANTELGQADISGRLKTIDGRFLSVDIEIKWKKDRQSEAQKAFEKQTVETGGIYKIIRTFDEFYEWYLTL